MSSIIRSAGTYGGTGRFKNLSETSIRAVLFITAIFAVLTVFFILVFLLKDAVPAFHTINLFEFLFGGVWNPTGSNPSYGTMPLWVGTILVTIGAMVIATPLGIGSAVYLSEIAPLKVKKIAKPVIELLAGIPSVVYGFFGLVVLTNWIRITFDVPSGECWLAGSILLGVMALPTIISVSEDAISAVPSSYKHGSLGLGATHWQTISKVLIPASISGITAAVILGMGRAIGETMAVLMVTGNAGIIPDPITNILSPVRTLAGTLGIEMGEVAVNSEHYYALFGVAVLLLAITLIVNIGARNILKKLNSSSSGTNTKKHNILKKCLSNVNINKNQIQSVFFVVSVILVILLFGISTAIAYCAVVAAAYILHNRLSPSASQKIAFILLYLSIAVVLLVLAIILYDIVSKGLPALSWEFLTQSPRDLGREGGIFPAIVGTLYLVAGSIIFALPVGVGAAVYLVEYTKESRLTAIIRSGVDLLNGTPSIVFGLFGFAFLVIYLNLGVCLLVGQITLGLMILPTIIRTTEEALKSVPQSVRHGSLALGATKWQTIRKVVLPPAFPGIITGTILSIGRAAGETAPIMFTAVVFSTKYLPSSEFDPVMALPYHLYILSTNIPGARTNQYGTALVLVGFVVIIYLIAIALRNHYQKSIKW
ncbi:phosphate transport system permease protein [Methanomicrobium sp. W14]|uniref:phosphate ABC transporter permease PstA n=1 Tax=Methanomicrobium sp. W14 TaxID=2817839 RepID=UPI001AE93806|nr:phosphate ABC transporter permease PstA [Methanomicrobium sp. W14]MBP2132733.1 phosphate transport system permease protein [Methanomicrobium sp. W14]